MGILGLLQYVKATLKTRRLSEYRGKTVAVDTYAWLHKIIKGPSGRELILGGPNRYKYVQDCLKRIAKIENLGIKVIMVFDGGPLPGKKDQEQSRKKRREETLAKGKEMLENGDEAGFKKLVDSIDITPDIAYRLIVELKKRNIQFIVAPYEADAQLAFLSRQGIADVIITEDSDLMAFGAKRMLYKLDFSTMMGSEMEIDCLPDSKEVNFTFFTHCMFLTTCILSGCDYLNQISGIGIKTAHSKIKNVTTFRGFLGDVPSKSLIPAEYENSFMKAFLTFRFQRVYCPIRKACVELNSFEHLEMTVEQMRNLEKNPVKWSQQVLNIEVLEYAQLNTLNYAFLGEKYSDFVACQIAEAEINPVTLKDYDINSSDNLTYVPTVPIRMNSAINGLKQNNYSKNSKYDKKEKPMSKEAAVMSKFLSENNRRRTEPLEKLNPFCLEYKSVRDGADSFIYQLEEKEESCFDKNYEEFKPVKGRLKLTEDNGEEESEEQSANISYLESESAVQEVTLIEPPSKRPKTIKSCKDELQHIAQKLFGQIFSQQYLKSPFSF